MQLSELKLVSASNIIRLRTQAGMTQVELGAKLNYSDKTVSKWERGEAIPDAYVLTRLADLFGVSVDYLLERFPDWNLKSDIVYNFMMAIRKIDDDTYSVDCTVDFSEFCEFFNITEESEAVSTSGFIIEIFDIAMIGRIVTKE